MMEARAMTLSGKSGRRWLIPGAALVAASFVLAGCGSGGSPAGSATSASASAAVSSGSAYAQQQVARLEAVTTQYPVPSATISGLSAFKGRTVFYIPLDAHIPGFVITAQTMKVALAKANVKFQECDGQSTPSAMATCVSQAEAANAAGIILDAIPYGMINNALNGAEAKGIPIIVADQYAPSGATSSDKVAYVQGVVDQPSQIAWWMIASSQGKANAVIGEEEDSPSSIEYVTNALAIFKQYCAGCTITVNPITATETPQQIQTSVTSKLQQTPAATYYYTEFEDSLAQAVAGVQAAGKSSSVSLSVAGGSTFGLGILKSGGVVKAVVCVDQAYAGWALSDEIFRMMTKNAPVTETFPSRLFTADNIAAISVTAADQSSGAWFGGNSYQSAFLRDWGA
jgi:ribose transport system substrate-binding protein